MTTIEMMHTDQQIKLAREGNGADIRNDDNCAYVASSSPVVSIIMPAYNVAEYIGETLDSIAAQTFTDHETIIVDDGSPDTAELERVIASRHKDERIVYIKQENLGAAAARNTALRMARAPFVAFLDADDLWLPDYLSEQLKFLEGVGEDGKAFDLVYADALLFGDSAQAGQTYMETTPSHGAVTFESLINATCNVITSGVVARREWVVQVGMFDEELRRAHDFDLWLRLARGGARLAYQRKVLLKYRIHAGSLSGDAVTRVERELRVYEKIEAREDLTTHERAVVQSMLRKLRADLKVARGKRELLGGDFAAAAEEFKDANLARGNWKLRVVLLWLRVAPRLLLKIYRTRAT